MPELTGKKPAGIRREVVTPGHRVGDVPTELYPEEKKLGPIGKFMDRNFLHFNAATVVEAAQAYCELIERGGKMFVAMAGAMSTGELGISLAEMIRKGKVHAICCTGANLEEDIFNLVAHSKYLRVPSWRDITPAEEEILRDEGLPRVTDTCIPEHEAMHKIEEVVVEYWKEAQKSGQRFFPHEYLYHIIRDGRLDGMEEIEKKDSWLLAAAKKWLPIYVFGWEDSTLGNMFASLCLKGELKPIVVKGGVETMMELAHWYQRESGGEGIGFFQLGGGIAGDGPICVVPLLKVDMGMEDDCPSWQYFCQISDSTTSYGSYSGAVPNEKISWAKIEAETPRFIIESDASIVAPLIFAYVLGQ